jgi:hypothetical protein
MANSDVSGSFSYYIDGKPFRGLYVSGIDTGTFDRYIDGKPIGYIYPPEGTPPAPPTSHLLLLLGCGN